MCRWWRYIRSMRAPVAPLTGSTLPRVDVEAAIDRGAVAAEKSVGPLPRGAPGREKGRREGGLERRCAPCRAKDRKGCRARGALDLPPQPAELLRAHPILRVEEHVAVDRGRGCARQKIGERGELGPHPSRPGREQGEGLTPQIVRHGALGLDPIASAEGLPGEIVLLERKRAGQAPQALAIEGGEVALCVLAQALELRRRNAEAIEGRGQAAEGADRAR